MSETTHREPPKPKNPGAAGPESMRIEPNKGSHVKHVIAVVSGKGGVGKSSVTAMSAVWARRHGYETAVMDADITGPSMPRMFGLGYADLVATEEGLYPAASVTGIKVMSMNLLTKQEDAPVIWRSPVITGALKQFWTDVNWGNVDYMFIDMPPGTGDVPLTVFQSLPIDGVRIVATPQELVGMIVRKALGMARMMKVPVLGIIENMSYVECPCCGEHIKVFGDSHVDETAEKFGIPVVARIPINPAQTAACDTGKAEYMDVSAMDGLAEILPQ